jgi:hypothetical protein
MVVGAPPWRGASVWVDIPLRPAAMSFACDCLFFYRSKGRRKAAMGEFLRGGGIIGTV